MFNFFNRNVNLSNKSELILEMENIMRLLNENKFSNQANAFIKPIEYLKLGDSKMFLKTLNSIDIWGGSGSAWEVDGFSSLEAKKNFLISFRKLVQLMQNANIKNSKAKSISKLFLREIELLD